MQTGRTLERNLYSFSFFFLHFALNRSGLWFGRTKSSPGYQVRSLGRKLIVKLAANTLRLQLRHHLNNSRSAPYHTEDHERMRGRGAHEI